MEEDGEGTVCISLYFSFISHGPELCFLPSLSSELPEDFTLSHAWPMEQSYCGWPTLVFWFHSILHLSVLSPQ